eukprot:scaffold368430_cov59-Attheya_sp.AAC.6
MQMAEAQHGLADKQYGSRKHHSAAEQALNKRLMFEILHVSKQSASKNTVVDLRSNYDLVIHSGASVALQQQGMPEQPIVYLWAFPFDHPPQGLGQGNGAAPAIWALVSTPVLHMLRKQGFGAEFKLAISGEEIHLVGYEFVDDSDIIQTAVIGDTDINKVFEHAQAGLNTFVGGMKASGGQVHPDKCNYCKIEFVWRNDKWKYASKKAPRDRQLYIQETPTKRTHIRQFNPSEAAETLGIWLAPDGNNKEVIKQMKIISKTWADHV